LILDSKNGATMKLAAALSATAILLSLPATSSAANGTFTQILCFNPDTGQGVGAPTEVRHLGGPPFPGLTTDCAGKANGGKGLTLKSGLPEATSNGMAGELEYRAPADVQVVDGEVFRIVRVGWGGQRVTMAQHAGPSLSFFALPRSELLQWWPSGAHDVGTAIDPWDGSNRLRLAVVDGVWRYTAGCDSAEGCITPGGSIFVRILGGKMSLRDDSDPQLVGSISGSLAEPAQISGTADLSFSASDSGSGLYRTKILVDDQPVGASAVDTNGGQCVDVNPTNSDEYEFPSASPCKHSASISAAFDTRQMSDGFHRIKVTVEDAGGNIATVLNKGITVGNRQVLPDGPGAQPGQTSLPALTFDVSRRRLRNGQALRYFGSLTGVGHARKFVDVQVRRSKTRWQVVCSVQTDVTGRYACRHRFKRTFRTTRYVFRARVRAQAGLSTETLVTRPRAVVVKPR
jgi:hypothetical protein